MAETVTVDTGRLGFQSSERDKFWRRWKQRLLRRRDRLRTRIHDLEVPPTRRFRLVALVLVASSVVLGASWFGVQRASCANQHWLLQFAGSNERLTNGPAAWDCSNAMPGLAADSLFALLYGVILSSLVVLLWPDRLHIKPLRGLAGATQARLVAVVPMAAAAFDLGENALSALAVVSPPAGSVAGSAITWVPMFAWAKWLLLLATLGGVVAIALTWLSYATEDRWTAVLRWWFEIRRWRLPSLARNPLEAQAGDVPRLTVDRASQGPVLDGPLGISCSGGGIRSGAFNIGALAALEDARVRPRPENSAHSQQPRDLSTVTIDPEDLGVHGLLGEATYLASVSGGGYAATSWRTAAGTGRLPARRIIGSPYLDADEEIRYPNSSMHERANYLYQHIRHHRQYLKNGRGGMVMTLLRAVGRLALHTALVVGVLFAIGWPIGRLAGSWLVADAVTANDGFYDQGFAFSILDHHWSAIKMLGGLAAVVFAGRLFTHRTATRRAFDRALMVVAGLLVTALTMFVAIPWTLTNVVPPLSDGRAPTVAGAYISSLGLVLGVAKSQLGHRIKYLGGALLAGLLVAFGALVSSHAYSPDRLFGLSPVSYLVIVLVLCGFVVLANPDAWSLHDVYRRKLAETFAARLVHLPSAGSADERDGAGEGFNAVLPLARTFEPMIDNYRAPNTEGPMPIICCSAARVETSGTGIPALSMTFAPDDVVVHGLADAEGDPFATASSSASLGAGGTAMSGSTATPWDSGAARYRRRLESQRLSGKAGSLVSLAAVSGAAVAPSLGRADLRSTNALLAALNLRLGVWLPNPTSDPNRDMPPRLVHMFKELLGWYDTDEEVLYVTDGGHWENLGLVELIRRDVPSCGYVICLDASNDGEGTFNTLREAIKLARLECDVRIELPDDEWEAIAPAAGPPSRNFAWGTITRPSGETAKLLYVKAAVAESTPLDLQRFKSEDPKFPNYATSDQFLSDREFTSLAKLGYHSVWSALCHPIAEQVFGPDLAATIRKARPADLAIAGDPEQSRQGASA